MSTYPMSNLKDKVVVVTGAGSGIGRALALAFAGRGAHVVCADLKPETAEATAREVATFGVRALGVGCDVSQASQVKALADRAEGEMGPVAVLVNNAGVALGGAVERLTLEDWHWQLGPNLWGVVHGVHFFLPAMLARGEGHIVNVASVAGLIGSPQLSAYATTKHAVVGFSESLRFELAHRGIGVTAVCPGFVRTGIFRAARVKADKPTPEELLLRTAMEPEALAAEVVAAVEANRPRVVTPALARAVLFIKHQLPGLWDWGGRQAGKLFHQRMSARG